MAGESARSQYERIRDERRQRVRNHRGLFLGLTAASVIGGAVAMHILLGMWWAGALAGLLPIVSILAPSEREAAWRKGAEGEQAVGRAIDELPSSRALHDRRIPGSRANIDHILIAPTGVWTIDAKNYTGKLETRRRGQELWIKGRNRSKLLEQAHRQTAVVRRHRPGDLLRAAAVLWVEPAGSLRDTSRFECGQGQNDRTTEITTIATTRTLSAAAISRVGPRWNTTSSACPE